jgi:hypothetical protein
MTMEEAMTSNDPVRRDVLALVGFMAAGALPPPTMISRRKR